MIKLGKIRSKGLLFVSASVIALTAAANVSAQDSFGSGAWASLEVSADSLSPDFYGSYNTELGDLNGASFEVGVRLPGTPYSLSFGKRNSAGSDSYDDYYEEDISASISELDLEIGRDIGLGSVGTGRLTFGVRGADLAVSSSYDDGYYSGSSDGGFSGIGPRIALEGSIPISGKTSLDFEVGAAVLFGDTANSYEYDYDDGGSGSGEDNFQSTATNLDLSVALSYLVTDNARISVGYRMEKFQDTGVYFGEDSDLSITTSGPFLKFTAGF